MFKDFKKIKRNQGVAMLISVIFFLFISLAIIAGLVSPSVREFKNAQANLSANQSYYLAESGSEDAMYRLLNNMAVASPVTLPLGSNSTTTTITSLSGSSKQISSVGNANSYERATQLTLSTGAGASFNYGVQVGEGGLYLSSGSINGNVYANGPITADGSGSNAITGTAISADSPAIVADQTNGSGTPAYNVIFGNANSTQDVAQSFQLATSSPLNEVQFYIKKVSTPSDATVNVVADNSGSPSTTVLATGTLSASSVTTSYGWVNVSFNTNPLLNTATTYWLVIDSGTSSSKYYTIGASSGGYANGTGKIGQFNGTWNNTTPAGLDYYFSVYLGGLTGSIIGNNANTELHIGTVSGTAQAHTVNYVNATGAIYCQSGTGNNKSCTSQTDPTYIADPISSGEITEWESDAGAGTVYNGNYTVPYNGATLGPEKIVGNLDVSGGATLDVKGTMYVTGNLTLDGGGTIELDPSYGSGDGVIVVNGTITIGGGGHATGSGTSGSYIMILTNNSSGSAASVSGGSGAVIVYAPNGTLNVSGGASLKEATAYQLSVTGGSSITYESGLANMNFSSGPSGSWTVQSWKESQ